MSPQPVRLDILRHFAFCPRCGRALPQPAPAPNYIECPACAFRCYFNPAAAVAAFVERSDGRVLFIRRALDPARGRLAPPGGFVDAGETAEAAVRREIREEVGIEVGSVEFLCSHSNQYLYREITYAVLDLFFVARMLTGDGAVDHGEVQSMTWLDPLGVDPTEMAFPSMQAALVRLQERLGSER